MLSFFRKKPTVGLDLGSYSLKLAGAKGRVVESLWQQTLIPERQHKDDMLAPDQLAKRVAELVSEGKARVANFPATVNIVTPGEGTIARYLEFPALSPKELAVAGPAEALRHIPHASSEINLSFMPVPALNEGKSAIFFVADQKSRVELAQNVLKEAGLKAKRIEVPLLSLIREYNNNHPGEQTVALVHCGFSVTQVLLMRGRYPYSYREIKLAGRDFTYAVQQGAQCPWAEAESTKLTYDVRDREVAVEPFLLRWLKEVKRSLGAVESESAGTKVEKVCLSGGSAAWTGLKDRLAEDLKKPVEVDTWEQVQAPSNGANPAAYKVAAGLTLE